ENGFQGKEGQNVPFMSDDFVNQISERYIELFEHITGDKFVKAGQEDVNARIFQNISKFLRERYEL
ncbi:MAG: phosphoribosylaminoimidazolesuccinocarboxamide synthase, partial [Bacteroidetes bacterium]|nr:phosphoribosylaminoimidazolesuccinocarboxamide synthase [Bacteroidota bacterium]